jgi:hypothetical protein
MKTMTTALKIVAFGILSSLASASASHAESLNMERGPEIERTLQTFRGNDFDIQYVHNWDHFSDRATGPISVPQRGPAFIQHIQATIVSNRNLAEALRAKGVDIRNIVNADQAADGGVTFYIR